MTLIDMKLVRVVVGGLALAFGNSAGVALAAAALAPTVPVPQLPSADEPDADAPTIANAAASAKADERQFRAAMTAWQQMGDDDLVLASAATPSVTALVPVRRPVATMRLSSKFGMRVHPVTGRWRHHNGIDIPAPRGTPIYATADGVVGRAQSLGGYGKYVEINHGTDLQTRYGHLAEISVQPGQFVREGEVIGTVGSTGRSTGNHLHYEVRREGTPVDPLPWLQQGDAALAALALENNLASGGPEE